MGGGHVVYPAVSVAVLPSWVLSVDPAAQVGGVL